MRNKTLEALVWVLIYGGLLAICVGLFVARQAEALGWAMMIGGAAAAAVGATLIWVRSRRSS